MQTPAALSVSAGGRVPARLRAKLLPLLALAATTAAALVLVDAQPLRSHWWIYDNADPSYTAAGLQLMAGLPVKFVDHPGIPLTELTAAVFGADYLLGKATGDASSRREYADRMMLDLDDARVVYRGQSILLYLAGALAAFALTARLLGHWSWGLAGAALWFAAPGLVALSIQMRPDVPLAALILFFAYLLERAADERSPGAYLLAAAAAGFATMLKLHAVGLVVPLVLLVLVAPPRSSWPSELRAQVTSASRRRTALLVAAGVGLLALAVAFAVERAPFTLTREQRLSVGVPVALVAGYLGTALLVHEPTAGGVLRRVFDVFYGAVAAAFLIGAALPAVLALPEGAQAVANVGEALRGRGINEGVDAFSIPLSRLFEHDLRVALVVFLLAGVAAVWGLAVRNPVPAIWFSGAVALGIMAQSRLGSTHYYMPAFMLSVPGALWLLGRGARGRPPLLVWPLLLLLVYPAFAERHSTRDEVERLARVAAPSLSALERRLREGEVAFTPSAWPNPDTRYFELVQRYVFVTPEYPYRFLPAAPDAAKLAEERGLRFRYFTGPAIFDVGGTKRIALGGLGEYNVRRLTDTDLAVELLEGPGADRPYDRSDAHYDPETGYFEDPAGRYWDRTGAQVANPPRRRYIPHSGLWLDANGDLWDARGNLVTSKLELQTAP